LEEEIIQHDIKFIILDSIASLVRKEFGGGSFHSNVHRTNLLTVQASSLKKLAEDFTIPVSVHAI
jgi:RAD51-like protein 1